jgi:hypothetical protein
VDRAQSAINLLRDETFKEVFEELRGVEMSRILMSDYDGIQAREDAYMRLRVLESIENHIEGMADQKMIDAKRLKIL